MISILVSLLLPSLQKVRAKALFAVCNSNSKQLAYGMTMYSNDNDEWICPTHQGNDATNQVWSKHTISPKYINSQEVFKCPTDTVSPKSYGPNGGSAGYNGLINYGQSLKRVPQVENDTYLLLEKGTLVFLLIRAGQI